MRCYHATLDEAVDLFRVEAQLLENLFIMLAKFRPAFCGYLVDAVNLNRAADRRGQLAARAFEWNDDVIRSQLWIVDHLFRPTHGAERGVDAIEDFVPMRNRLRSEYFVEDCCQLRHVRHQVLWGEPWIG